MQCTALSLSNPKTAGGLGGEKASANIEYRPLLPKVGS